MPSPEDSPGISQDVPGECPGSESPGPEEQGTRGKRMVTFEVTEYKES